MKVNELLESNDITQVHIKDLGDGKFLVYCDEKKGPMLNIIGRIAHGFYERKGVKVTTKSGLPADFRRLYYNKINAYIFTFSNPEGAKEKLKDFVDKSIKLHQNEMAREARWKAGAEDRKKKAAQRDAAQRKQDIAKLEKLYGKGTYKRVKYRQVGGDDGYQYTVFIDGRPFKSGLTRDQAQHEARHEMAVIAQNECLGIFDPKDKEAFLKNCLLAIKSGGLNDHVKDWIKIARARGYDYPEFKAIEKSLAHEAD